MNRACVALVALIVTACSPAGSDPSPLPSEAAPSQEAPSMSPEPQPSASLSLSSEQPVPVGDSITGVLGADAIEGGCAYLASPDGTRYEVIYPDGWRVQLSPLQLLDPNGTVVATGGDEVTVRGSLAGDMASICQIGPIFRATEVDR